MVENVEEASTQFELYAFGYGEALVNVQVRIEVAQPTELVTATSKVGLGGCELGTLDARCRIVRGSRPGGLTTGGHVPNGVQIDKGERSES